MTSSNYRRHTLNPKPLSSASQLTMQVHQFQQQYRQPHTITLQQLFLLTQIQYIDQAARNRTARFQHSLINYRNVSKCNSLLEHFRIIRLDCPLCKPSGNLCSFERIKL